MVALALAGCPERVERTERDVAPASPAAHAPEAQVPAPSPPATASPENAPVATATSGPIDVPAGSVVAGSTPGGEGRDPRVEADAVSIALGAFAIDRAPFPGGGDGAPRTAVSRSEAEALCRARDARLCTELEWERACDAGGDFALAPGVAEWTASIADPRFESGVGLAVVRGGGSRASSEGRCATRAAVAPDARRADLGFRCCAGEPRDAAYPAEPARPTFREIDVPLDDLRAALTGVPALARYAGAFTPFTADDVSAVFTRGNAEPELPPGVRRASKVVEWSPGPGELAWVVTGRSGGDSILAVIHPLPDGGFAHGASMVLEGDPLSILVTYAPGNPRSLAWTTCFGCAGEGGEVQYRSDHRIVVVQL